MKRTISTIAGVAALAVSSVAFSYSADFTDTTEEFIEGDVYVTGEGWTYTFTGSPDLAHVDSSVAVLNNGGNGGIGVCAPDAGDPDECSASSDDGLDVGETLTLTFSTARELSSMTFNNAIHSGPVTTAGVWISIDGAAAVSVASALGVLGTVFDITYDGNGNPYSGVYLASFSVVPVPAAGILFGSALIGFLGYTRRKSKLEEAA